MGSYGPGQMGPERRTTDERAGGRMDGRTGLNPKPLDPKHLTRKPLNPNILNYDAWDAQVISKYLLTRGTIIKLLNIYIYIYIYIYIHIYIYCFCCCFGGVWQPPFVS